MPPSELTLASSRLLYTHGEKVQGVAWMGPRWLSAGIDHCVASGTLDGGDVTRTSLVLRAASVTITPNYVLVPSTYGPVSVLDRTLRRVVGTLDHWDTCRHACCVGTRLFTASYHGSIREWPAEGPFGPPVSQQPGLRDHAVRSSGDGELWQVELKKSLNAFAVEPERVWAAFHDGVRVWPLVGATPAKRPVWLAPHGCFYTLALVGERVVAGTAGKTPRALVWWNRRTRAHEGSTPLDHSVHRLCSATAHERAWLLGAGEEVAWIRDPACLDDAPVVTVRWPGHDLEDCALTPAGDLIVAGGNEVRVWAGVLDGHRAA
ncbi:hypothetical protein [Nannocystis radixulma]|uniref:Uncharacterized protein n=1 Tax=Nannocystis radixulma TaxID=2995305 RepID=A0ABT5BQL3_9BACT|nr:hypothetical protein [Nannocystis radixulma]MDC0676008.1 hypothetical protein [Nannocystis radixulma]